MATVSPQKLQHDTTELFLHMSTDVRIQLGFRYLNCPKYKRTHEDRVQEPFILVHSKVLQLSHAFFCSGNIRCTKRNMEIRGLILSIYRNYKGEKRKTENITRFGRDRSILSHNHTHTLKARLRNSELYLWSLCWHYAIYVIRVNNKW